MSFGPGQLLIPNEDTASRGASISSVTGALVQTGLSLGAPSGEAGAVVSNGTFAVNNKNGGSNIHDIQVFDASFTLLSTNAIFTSTGGNVWGVTSPIASDFSGLFYGSKVNGVSSTQLKSFTPLGVVGSTWTLDVTNVIAMGVSQDNTTLYYADGANGGAIKAWDLVHDAALGVIVPGFTTNKWFEDLLVIPGTSTFVILVQPNTGVSAFEVRRYTTAGALLQTFALPSTAKNGSDPRLSLDIGAPSLAFWARTFPDGGDSSQFQFNLVTGLPIAPTPFTIPADSTDPSQAPLSCPFFAWSDNVPSPVTLRPPWPLVPPFTDGMGGLETVAQRRLRVSPHLSAEQFQIFYDQFTLDLQVGNGILTGQGVNPQIMLRMSDDGGYTWSDEILLDSGAQGQYLTRVTANGLGQARDRVFEISTSDPVSWSIIGAYLNTRKGRW